jgi:hypothetical protein
MSQHDGDDEYGDGPEPDDDRPRGRRRDDDRDDDLEATDRPRRGPGRREPEPLRFSGDEQRDKTGDERAFIIEDPDTGDALTPVLYAYRPKQWMLLKIGEASGQEQIDLFLDEVMDGESADYLRARFEDPDDDFDVDSLAETITGLLGLWYGRPTGRPSGSRGRRGNPRSGRRSTVRRR